MTDFDAEVHQNQYLPVGGTEVDAIVRVIAAGAPSAAATESDAAEIVIVDCSGSMDYPRPKMKEAKAATVAAVDCIRDGVRFAVLGGTESVARVYPSHGGLVVASNDTRAAARKAIAGLKAKGGTAIGQWLACANNLFADSDGTIHHVILLTDGQNHDETPEELDAALARCEGNFQCDCRGVGDDWEVAELRRISSALLGTVDIIREPEEISAEFTAMMETAMGKAVNDVALRVWTPRGAEVAFLKQVAPTIEDLTARRADVSELVGDYRTGSWGTESRDYHLRITVPTRAVGEQMLAGRASLVVDDEPVAEAKILAIWTDDEAVSTKLNLEVAHATGQVELANEIQDGIAALGNDDTDGATRHLVRAVELAEQAGDTVRLEQLRNIVDVDATTGTVRLRPDAKKLDVMTLDTASTKTIRRMPQGSSSP